MSIISARTGGGGAVELMSDGNFSVALVYCDKMIKRQRIKCSDSKLDIANIETNGRSDHTLYGIFRCFFV